MRRHLTGALQLAVPFLVLTGLTFAPSTVGAQDATPAASPCARTDESTNTALAEAFMMAFDTGDVADLRSVLAPDEVHHWGVGPDAVGADAVTASISAYAASFDDLQVELMDTIVADDLVVVRWQMTGAQTSSFAGVGPSDQTATWSGINIFRIACGQITESWNETDHLGRLRATGVITESELSDVAPADATPTP